MIGKRVRFKDSDAMPRNLVGKTGEVVASHEGGWKGHYHWHILLDDPDLDAYPSRKAWADTDELEVLE